MKLNAFTPLAAAAALVFLAGCTTLPMNPAGMSGTMDHGDMATAMPMEGMDHGNMTMPMTTTMEGMDHGDMAGMDHGAMMGQSGAPFDAEFIDGMVAHHEGAIAMAQQVLAESERPELLAMADAIIAAQSAEIAQMTAWRADWYPDLAAIDVSAMAMGDMVISSDETLPFDQRFLNAMISHHLGAIQMATAALANAEQPAIKTLAAEIITAQTAEIAQMQGWLSEWFGR